MFQPVFLLQGRMDRSSKSRSLSSKGCCLRRMRDGLKRKRSEFALSWYSEELGTGLRQTRDIKIMIHYQLRMFKKWTGTMTVELSFFYAEDAQEPNFVWPEALEKAVSEFFPIIKGYYVFHYIFLNKISPVLIFVALNCFLIFSALSGIKPSSFLSSISSPNSALVMSILRGLRNGLLCGLSAFPRSGRHYKNVPISEGAYQRSVRLNSQRY